MYQTDDPVMVILFKDCSKCKVNSDVFTSDEKTFFFNLEKSTVYAIINMQMEVSMEWDIMLLNIFVNTSIVNTNLPFHILCCSYYINIYLLFTVISEYFHN